MNHCESHGTSGPADPCRQNVTPAPAVVRKTFGGELRRLFAGLNSLLFAPLVGGISCGVFPWVWMSRTDTRADSPHGESAVKPQTSHRGQRS
jgi:hypothetical protein